MILERDTHFKSTIVPETGEINYRTSGKPNGWFYLVNSIVFEKSLRSCKKSSCNSDKKLR